MTPPPPTPPAPKRELTEKQKAEKEARAAEKAKEAAAEAKKAELLEEEDNFAFSWGDDFPEAMNAMHMTMVPGHPINPTLGPKQLLMVLADPSEFRAATPRRPGKGKPLPASPSEGEMELQSRRDCQKACRRLIMPKPEKGEPGQR